MEFTIYRIISFLLTLITLAIIVRVLLSWFYPVGRDPWTRLLLDVTEPLLAPIRNVMTRILPIPLDFSPIVVILLIQLLQNMLAQAMLR
ncbi:MAG TPA: YggT family protein [Chloroflexia bacterium]|nr:YggT family protein [Chloroflexia bacterium]